MIDYICLFILCGASPTGIQTPSRLCHTIYLGDATKEITDKMIDNVAAKGTSYSYCGTKSQVENHRFWKAIYGE